MKTIGAKEKKMELHPMRHLLYCPGCVVFQRQDMLKDETGYTIRCPVCGTSEKFIRTETGFMSESLYKFLDGRTKKLLIAKVMDGRRKEG